LAQRVADQMDRSDIIVFPVIEVKVQ